MWKQNYRAASTFLNNDIVCVKVLIQNIWLGIKTRERRKLVFENKL